MSIVVKPLSKQLKSLVMYAGATVLGDGSAALILDTTGLARYAGLQPESLSSLVAPKSESSDRQLILLVLGTQNSPLGIFLTSATRLEIVPRAAIERVGDRYLLYTCELPTYLT
jgi:two-component system chemotaxis sensor kinase CheA